MPDHGRRNAPSLLAGMGVDVVITEPFTACSFLPSLRGILCAG